MLYNAGCSALNKLLKQDVIAKTAASGSYYFTQPYDDETLASLALWYHKTPNNIFFLPLLQLYNFVRGNSVTLWWIIF